MFCYVVTEGQRDVLILKKILGDLAHDRDVKIVSGGGWSGADSLARTLLVTRKLPVALVVDADTYSQAGIAERESFLKDSLGQVAFTPYKVLLAVPEIEALLFRDRTLLTELVGREVDSEDLIRGEYEPRKTLRRIVRNLGKLESLDLTVLQSEPIIQELIGFISSVRSPTPALA